MTATQYYMPVNTLRGALDAARPKLAQQAIEQAEANLEKMSGECLLYIDGLLDALEALTAPPGERWGADAMRKSYELALRFIGPASLAGLHELERAAKSLCDLADVLAERGSNDRQPVRVHVEAMRLLRLPEAAEAGSELIEGLEQVKLRFMRLAGEGEVIAAA